MAEKKVPQTGVDSDQAAEATEAVSEASVDVAVTDTPVEEVPEVLASVKKADVAAVEDKKAPAEDTGPVTHPFTPPTSRYGIVVLAAKRAKQLREGARPLVTFSGPNMLTAAIAEVSQQKVSYILAEEGKKPSDD